MSAILDQIKRNAVPAAVVRTASKGALPLPAGEMLEVLVYLTKNPVFSQDARMTLAGWDLESAKQVVSQSDAVPEVLGYFWQEENRRPALMPVLIENPAIPESLLMELAASATREIVHMLMTSPRARNAPAVSEALAANPAVTPEQLRELKGGSAPEPGPEAQPDGGIDVETDAAHAAWTQEHAAEIAAEEGKGFELTAGDDPPEGDGAVVPQAEPVQEALAVAALAAQSRSAAAAVEDKRLTIMQKIARMTASERVKAAFTGSKEERAILIRDGARVVQNAVLASPKLTDPEVETFAAAKNVNENVLREIARNRRFMKHYPVIRNLVLNPKTPLDIALPLVKMMLVYDLKGLQHNKNVADTIRKVAQKYYKEKATSGGKTKD